MRGQAIASLAVLAFLFSTAEGQGCFRGKPLPHCKSFWITESGAFYRLNGHEGKRWSDRKFHDNLYCTGEIGHMVNRTPTIAYGGAVFLGWDGYVNDIRVGFKGRFRRWLTPTTGLDLAPGILWSDKIGGSPIWCLSASFCAQDRLIIISQVEMVTWGKRRPLNSGYFGQGTDLFWYAGLRFGSECGLIAMVAIPIIILITAAPGIGNGTDWGSF